MARKYYSLISLDAENTGVWGVEFGDYDRDVVEQERRDLFGDDYCDTEHAIICTGDAQRDIDEGVRKLNERRAGLTRSAADRGYRGRIEVFNNQDDAQYTEALEIDFMAGTGNADSAFATMVAAARAAFGSGYWYRVAVYQRAPLMGARDDWYMVYADRGFIEHEG